MTLVNTESMRRFDEDDREFAEQVAARAAIAVENARLATARRETASTLQRSLLPDVVPGIDGWSVATLYRAARAAEEVEVGGDFYDFYESDGWLVLLGDVTGKGIEAAALTSLVRHGARFLSRYERRPSRILAGLNAALGEQPGLLLCTALCVRLHARPGDHRLGRAPAGARRARRRPRAGDRRRRTDPGRLDRSGLDDYAVPIAGDETLFLYTDGVLDTRGEDERFGLRRLKRLLCEHAGRPPERLLAELEAALDRFQVGPQADDTAALALRPVSTAAAAQASREASRGPSSVPFLCPDRRGHVSALPNFRIETIETGSGITIKLGGELDSATCDELVSRFEQLAASRGLPDLVLDLSEVSFIDSSGMRAIILIERSAGERGFALTILPPPEALTDLLAITGIADRATLAPQAGDASPTEPFVERIELELPREPTAPARARPSCARRSAGASATPTGPRSRC